MARRILLLDDDALVRRTTAAVLRDAGFIVADPDDAKSALGLLDAGMPYDLLIVDLSMPDMSGDVFAIEARRRRPGLPVLFMTGYPNGLSATREEPCLLKPCRRAEILGTIDTILSASPMVDCDPPFEMPSGGAWERSRDRLRVLSASERYGDR